jgi:aquaporin Z
MKRAIMEFMGTFFLVLTIAITGNPLAIASILMAWLYIGGFVSGAHYNPLVSLAVALRGRMNWNLVPHYMIAQILGGLAAYATAFLLLGKVIIPAPAAGVSLGEAFVVEVLLSFVLASVILNVATAHTYEGNDIFGFAIGFTIPALAAFGGPISGGLFNPAISIGSMAFAALKGMPISYEHLAMYVGGALLGGALAAYFFKYFHPEDR